MCCFSFDALKTCSPIFGFHHFDHDMPQCGIVYAYSIYAYLCLFLWACSIYTFLSFIKLGEIFCHFYWTFFSLLLGFLLHICWNTWYLYKMFCCFFPVFFLSFFMLENCYCSLSSLILSSPSSCQDCSVNFFFKYCIFQKILNFFIQILTIWFWGFVFLLLLKFSIFFIYWAHTLFCLIENHHNICLKVLVCSL